MVDTILTPDAFDETPIIQEEQNSFLVDNYFSELVTDDKKEIARNNLGVYGKADLYTQNEVENYVTEKIEYNNRKLLSEDDPHHIIPKVNIILQEYLKTDGGTPFTRPQGGVDPEKDSDLTTKSYVENLLDDRIKRFDSEVTSVKDDLTQYALKNTVYRKNDVYTKEVVDDKIKPFVKTDGTTPFVAPQSGNYIPKLDQHLTNKRYVDNALFKHNVSADPHGFLTILNLRLVNYYKTSETYSKAETYSRALIDKVIRDLVIESVKPAIKEHTRQFDPHNTLKEVFKEHYVKRDGSVPFTDIQKGVDGIEDDDLITLRQLNRAKREIEDKIEKPIWVTSGPILTTVGYLEDNSYIPAVMSFQEVMDAIFYGNVIDVKVPEIASIGTSIPVTMTIRGNALINKASLYLGDILIGEYEREHFLDWYYTVDSKPILKNTVFTFIVEYINGLTVTASSVCNVSYGIFVGAVPKMCMPRDLIYNAMLQIVELGQGAMLSYGENVEVIKHKFDFESPYDPKKLVLAIPSSYNLLDYMHTASLHFGINAFLVEEVSVRVPNLEEAVSYTYYVYNQPLIAFDSEVTFKLSKHE